MERTDDDLERTEFVYAENNGKAGEALVKPTYAESVLAARRLRAGWEFMGQEQPKETQPLPMPASTTSQPWTSVASRPMTSMHGPNGSR